MKAWVGVLGYFVFLVHIDERRRKRRLVAAVCRGFAVVGLSTLRSSWSEEQAHENQMRILYLGKQLFYIDNIFILFFKIEN